MRNNSFLNKCLFLVASCYYSLAPSSDALVTRSDALVSNSFLLLLQQKPHIKNRTALYTPRWKKSGILRLVKQCQMHSFKNISKPFPESAHSTLGFKSFFSSASKLYESVETLAFCLALNFCVFARLFSSRVSWASGDFRMSNWRTIASLLLVCYFSSDGLHLIAFKTTKHTKSDGLQPSSFLFLVASKTCS